MTDDLPAEKKLSRAFWEGFLDGVSLGPIRRMKFSYPLVWLLDFVSRKLGNHLVWGAPTESELRRLMGRRDQRIVRYFFNRCIWNAYRLNRRFKSGYYVDKAGRSRE